MSLYKRRPSPDLAETINIVTLLVGIVLIAVVLSLLVRFQRGLLGIVLGGLAIVLASYWMLELRRTLKRELKIRNFEAKEWSPDIIDDTDEILIVGKVPGPEEKIKVILHENLLEVKGGLNFSELIRLPSRAVSFNTAYNNGVLEVRLKK